MNIRFQKRFGLILFFLFTVAGAWMAIDKVDRLAQSAASLRDQPFELAESLVKAHDEAFHAHSSLHDAVIAGSAAERARHLSAVDHHSVEFYRALETLSTRQSGHPDQLKPLFAALADWRAMRNEVLDLLAEGRANAAHRHLSTAGERLFRRQHDVMAILLDNERVHVTEMREEALAAERAAERTAMGLSVVAAGALVAMVLGYATFIRTHRPLIRLRETLVSLAAGNHDGDIPHVDQPGAIGSLARAIQRFQESMAERDAAMAALTLSEDRLKTALSIAPMTVFNLDRDLRYTWLYNPQIPIAAADFLGRTGAEFFEPEGYADREMLFRRVLATGMPASGEIVLRLHGAAEEQHFQQVAAPLWDRFGRIIGLTCAAIDITDRVRAREALLDAVAEARRATEAKSRFLSAASHDLRQPLQALRLFLDTLDERPHGEPERRMLDGALSALAAGEELLRNYLDVSVLEAGLIRPDPRDFPVREILTDLAAECASEAAEKGLSFRLALCNASVRSDPQLLRNLLRNLLANAIRYTDRGGILIGCRRSGSNLKIQVWDTGIGIPADKLGEVFEDFYQIGNMERDRTKGLGLGLSVVDRAARLLGHDVTASSRPGLGSVFTVTVPLSPVQRVFDGRTAAA